MSEDYWIENDTLHFDDLYDSIVPLEEVPIDSFWDGI